MRRGKRTYRTDVDRVKRVVIFEALVWMRREDGVASPFGEPEHIVLCNFLTKANTARAKDAPLVIKRNARTKLNPFRFFDLVFEEP